MQMTMHTAVIATPQIGASLVQVRRLVEEADSLLAEAEKRVHEASASSSSASSASSSASSGGGGRFATAHAKQALDM
jgi:hypothetical protein